MGTKGWLYPLDLVTASVLGNLLHISGFGAERDGTIICLTNSTWAIVPECTAIFIMCIYSAFIAVYPSSLRAKAIALLAGIPFIFFANMLRLYLMAWIDKLRPEYSDYFHKYGWEVAFIVMIVYMWIIWIDKVVAGEE